MGCNLCTLQKREEHYKLLYEIAQANPVLQRQMLCHMSILLDSMKGARQTPLHPATTYGVRRVPQRAGDAVVRASQPSPPYGHL
ncbi:hypothetical protein Q5P01_003530 [Channa striata]|uniref:Uncharacterized protein n=1 Tax=Channa striata TaxID=64152 RepID=A0AA88NM84_CHASR|nr:hypothetical protein Q5P01_003530 [Channa striata]